MTLGGTAPLLGAVILGDLQTEVDDEGRMGDVVDMHETGEAPLALHGLQLVEQGLQLGAPLRSGHSQVGAAVPGLLPRPSRRWEGRDDHPSLGIRSDRDLHCVFLPRPRPTARQWAGRLPCLSYEDPRATYDNYACIRTPPCGPRAGGCGAHHRTLCRHGALLWNLIRCRGGCAASCCDDCHDGDDRRHTWRAGDGGPSPEGDGYEQPPGALGGDLRRIFGSLFGGNRRAGPSGVVDSLTMAC